MEQPPQNFGLSKNVFQSLMVLWFDQTYLSSSYPEFAVKWGNLEPQLDRTSKRVRLHGWHLRLAAGGEQSWACTHMRRDHAQSDSKRPTEKLQGVLWPSRGSINIPLLPHYIGQPNQEGQPWSKGRRTGPTPWCEVLLADRERGQGLRAAFFADYSLHSYKLQKYLRQNQTSKGFFFLF